VIQVTDADTGAGNTVASAGSRGPAGACSLQEPHMFKSNVGNIDRVLRVVLGLALITMTLMGTIGVWGWIGIVPLITAAMGSCPLYSVLGMSTCPMKKT
jgi:hypothetical protein